MKATRRDVAERAGVSEQTVSYVLNNSRKFTPDLIERVRAAVRELNYQPDMIAKSMVTKHSKAVCVVVNDIANPIFGEIVHGFEDAACERGYFVSLVDAKSDFDNHSSDIISRRIEGVYVSLISSHETAGFVRQLLRSGVKVVLGNEILSSSERGLASVVEVDLDEGMNQILGYLAELGHRDIVYLSGLAADNGADYRYRSFLKNYRSKFGKEGIVVENEYPFETTVESGYRTAQKLLSAGIPFTAAVATNDLMAYGAMQCFKERGLRIPEDVSVVGIDDIFFSRHTSPPLTTLGFDKEAYGRRLFEILRVAIEDEDGKGRKELFGCSLEVRGSTRPL